MKDLTKNEEILLLAIWQLKDEAYGVKIRSHISKLSVKTSHMETYTALSSS